MAENGPTVSFNVGGLSVALWENEREKGEGTRKSVTVRKSFWSAEKKGFEERSITLNVNEVSCLARLLQKMQEAVIERRGETTPF